MTDADAPNERLLDLALEEVAGGLEPPDVSERVLREAGHRTPDGSPTAASGAAPPGPSDLATPPPGLDAPLDDRLGIRREDCLEPSLDTRTGDRPKVARSRRPRRPLAIAGIVAAAAAAVLLLAIGFALVRGPEPEPDTRLAPAHSDPSAAPSSVADGSSIDRGASDPDPTSRRPPILARASAPLRVLRLPPGRDPRDRTGDSAKGEPADGEPADGETADGEPANGRVVTEVIRTDELLAGDLVVGPEPDEASESTAAPGSSDPATSIELALVDGTRARIHAWTVLRIDRLDEDRRAPDRPATDRDARDAAETRIALHAGHLRLETGARRRGLRLDLPLGSVTIPPGGEVMARVDPRVVHPSQLERAREALHADGFSPADSWVEPLVGEVALRVDGGSRSIAPGSEAFAWAGDAPAIRTALPEVERRDLESLARETVRRGDPVAERLRATLDERPAAWDAVRPILTEVAATERATGRQRAFELLVDDPHPITKERLAEFGLMGIWDPDLLIRLAERGVETARARLGIWVEARSPALERQVYAALWLARDGDRSGLRVMRKAARGRTELLRDSNAYFAAAAGLHILGEFEAWTHGLEWLGLEVDRDAVRGGGRNGGRDGAEPTAVRILRADYFRAALDPDTEIDLTSMDDPVLDHVERHLPELDSAGAMRAWIESLRVSDGPR